jgi:membrane associated rhomboid family serine protease
MKYLFLLSFLIVFCLFGLNLGFVGYFPIWKHLTYNFQHANLVHLILNSIAFFSLFRILELKINAYKLAVFILSAAFAASFAVHYAKPTVGASAMVYAMIGLYLVMANTNEIRITKKQLITWEVCLFISLIVSAINPHSAFLLHLTAFVIGLAGGGIRRLNMTKKDD